ncbi:hypothetical protein BAE44_0010295, partial [Dichanthelium oligosanthes]
LVRRNWPGDIECKLCGILEITDHIMFRCVMAQFVWCVCRDAFGWSQVPDGVDNFQETLLWLADKQTRTLLIFLFGCVSWSLWLIRNDLVFNNVVVSSPEVGVYRLISFMQRWSILSKGQQQVKAAIGRLQLQLSVLRQSEGAGDTCGALVYRRAS